MKVFPVLVGSAEITPVEDGSAEIIPVQVGSAEIIPVQVGSAEIIPVEDGSVDAVFCCMALHWLNHDKFFAEVQVTVKHKAWLNLIL